MSDVIFCGNPGVGKSTLLSSISNQTFESGLSWGEGCTSTLQFQESPDLPGIRFGDTPGLADISMAERAAKAISQAFNDAAAKRRTVKIFFVVTVESGRVRPDDLFTIKQVMGSIQLPNGSRPGRNAYGLIINKCTFLALPDFESKGKPTLESVVAIPSETVPCTTSYVTFLPKIDDAVDANNKKVMLKGFMEWVLTFPGLSISCADLIDVSNLEEKLRKAKELHKREMEELEKKLTESSKKELDELRRQMEESKQDMKKKLQDAEDRADARGGGIIGAVIDGTMFIPKRISYAIHSGNSRDFEQSWCRDIADFKRKLGLV